MNPPTPWRCRVYYEVDALDLALLLKQVASTDDLDKEDDAD